MKNIIYPYPFKLSTTGDLSDGIVFQIPSFCKSNHKTKKCRDFYTKECEIEGYKQCPYGFAVSINRFLGQKVIFSCLYIDKISDRKMVQRRLSEKDFMPRISLANYEKSINNISILTNSSVDFYKKENEEIISKETYIDKIEILDNTFHELRKLNQELKLQTEHLIYQSNNFSWNNVGDIKYLSQNIFSTSQLISIRLNTYDFGVNPNLSLYEEKSPIQIHKKFVKVAHCLREYANKKQIKIQITGESYSSIMANDVLELLPYLILDNAIKYSLENKNIDIRFSEKSSILEVVIKSFSVRPHEHELRKLTERGVRSTRIDSQIQGQGIGLYLANYICELHNISMDFRIGKERFFESGIPYSDFYVSLIFYDIIKDESVDYTFDID